MNCYTTKRLNIKQGYRVCRFCKQIATMRYLINLMPSRGVRLYCRCSRCGWRTCYFLIPFCSKRAPENRLGYISAKMRESWNNYSRDNSTMECGIKSPRYK